MKLKKYLNQPFPKADSKWKLIILISLFVSLFLIVFQPFGINLMKGHNKYIILLSYGLVTFFTLVINLIIIERIFPKTFNERNWTIGKEFAWLLWIIFSIGLGNAFYTNYFINYFQFNFRFFIQFQSITFTVGVIPITMLIITKQKYLLRKNLESASELNKNLNSEKTDLNQNKLIHFFADNDKDFVEFDVNDFYFIESSGNYVELYLIKENKIARKTFRSTLKRSLDFFIDSPEVIQCHRAFIVNTTKISIAKGNSQGLILNLENCDYEIPVSRNYVDMVRNQIK
ncbi:MAG TPA: hypothetical protein DCG75_12860 [Bacteroidales bacterium]|nr:hypothetical protein [Bacteroidales bacterium]